MTFWIRSVLQLKRFPTSQRVRWFGIDKTKDGRLGKIGEYMSNILNDYKQAVVEVLQDMKTRPLKASIYLCLLGGTFALSASKPSEQSYNADVIERSHDLLLIGELIRNSNSEAYIKDVVSAYKDGRLHFLNFGVCRVVWKSDYSTWVQLYEAQCKLVKPSWTQFHKQIVDVGFVGRWIYLNRAMEEYDINVDEWADEKSTV